MVNIVLLLLLRVFLCSMYYEEAIGETDYSLSINEELTKTIPRNRYKSTLNNTVYLKQSFTGSVYARLVTPSVLGNFDYFSSYRTTIDGRFMYICGYTTDHSIFIVDISNILKPKVVGKIDRLPKGYCHMNNAFVYYNDHLYLSAGSYGYSLINVEDRKKPRYVDTYRFIVYDTQVDTNSLSILPPYLLVGDGRDGMKIIDVSNATGPKLYHSMPTVENGTGKIYHIALLRDNTILGLGTNKGIHFYNFTSLKNPTFISKENHFGFAASWKPYWNDKYIFIPYANSGTYTVDYTNITNPKFVSWMSSLREVVAFTVDGDEAYFGLKSDPKLYKVNVTDPTKINILQTVKLNGPNEDVTELDLFNSSFLVASLNGNGFEIFNVSTNFTSIFFPNGRNMITEVPTHGDGNGYIIGGRNSRIADVYKRIIAVVGTFYFDLFEFREGMLTFKSRLYHGSGQGSGCSIRILNEDYLVKVAAYGSMDEAKMERGTFVYNISDLSNPFLVYNNTTPNFRGAVAEYIRPRKFLVIGYAYSDDSKGSILVNFSDPTAPKKLNYPFAKARYMGYEESENVLYIFSQEERSRIYTYNFSSSYVFSQMWNTGLESEIHNPRAASYNKYFSTLFVQDNNDIEPLTVENFRNPQEIDGSFETNLPQSTTASFLQCTGKTMILGTTTYKNGFLGVAALELESNRVGRVTGLFNMSSSASGIAKSIRDNVVFAMDSSSSLNVIRFDYEVVDSGKSCGVGTVLISAFTDDSSEGTLNDTITVTKALTCVHGYCGNAGKCVCDHGYEGDACENVKGEDIKCFDKDQSDPGVCSERGKCVDHGKCDCQYPYAGEDCGTNLLTIILSSTGVTLLLGGGVGIVFVFICTCLCCIFCCGLCIIYLLFSGMCIVCCFSCCGGCVYLRLNKKMSKFKELKNFDLLLAEQKAEDDHSIAKIKIDKNLYAIPYDEILLDKILGEGGSNSVVYKVKWRGQVAAFKCFKTRHVMGTQNDYDEFEREVTVMGNVNHPHILQFMGCCLDPPRIGILMEFCEKGDLRVFLMTVAMSTGKMYPFIEKLRMCLEMSQALDYLHSRQIIHRDLKLENVLVTKSESTKLMDFGLSRRMERISMVKTKSIGTSYYIAPEVITSNFYDEKCDVFSFAIMLYIIFSEEHYPYGVESMNTELRVAQDPSFRPSIEKLNKVLPEDYIWISDVVEKNWGHEPTERNSFSELVAALSEKQVFFDTKKKEKLEEEGGDDAEESGEITKENELERLVESLRMELMEKERVIEARNREIEEKDQKIKELEEKYVYKKLFEKRKEEVESESSDDGDRDSD